ncbi:MAG: Gfo/Idh/MocA family protein [Bacteroidota bacterium]
MNKIRFGVIGCGHIGKRHAEMVIRQEGAELVAMCDVRSQEECAVSYEVPFYHDPVLMMKEENLDVICVCTPNGLHAEHSLLALRNGKHVVVEKPMALSKADCEEIVFESLKANKQVFCVMQNRYSPPSEWIKSILEENVLGEIYMVNVDLFWNRDDRYYKPGGWKGVKSLDGGTLFTQFSHFIDIMFWLFGDITNIQARLRDFKHQHSTEFEDSGIVLFDFLKGGMGSINFSTAVNYVNYESSLTIVAEKGTVKIGGQYMNEVAYCEIENYTMPELAPGNPANDYGAYKGSAANHIYVIQNVVDALNGKGQITTNAMEGLKVVEIIERIYSAAQKN